MKLSSLKCALNGPEVTLDFTEYCSKCIMESCTDMDQIKKMKNNYCLLHFFCNLQPSFGAK